MSTAGIVAEYNPFHNGHAYHITRTRENGASAVVCVMSSWFVQRGETALMHPNARARMALMNGADLVVSLPVPWACAAAQTFARGAVGLLDAMGCVDTLSFGSEFQAVLAEFPCLIVEKRKRSESDEHRRHRCRI